MTFCLRALLRAGCVLSMFSPAPAGWASTFSFTSLVIPNSQAGTTLALGVNNQGQIVGSYRDINGLMHGFLRNSDASIVSIDFSTSALGSVVTGISDTGAIVGIFTDDSQKSHGFVRSPDGTAYTSFDVPNAFPSSTNAFGVDNAGEIVGTFQDASKKFHGFLRSADGNSYTIIDAPVVNSETHITGINNNGATVGYFISDSGAHSFIRNAGGAIYSIFDVPEATLSTNVAGINDIGQTVGVFYGQTGIHNFLRSADGTAYVIFDDPSVPAGDSNARGINNAGYIVGYSMESFDRYHGFVAAPLNPVPEASSASLLGLGILGLTIVATARRPKRGPTSGLDRPGYTDGQNIISK
jgi:uncharacterized membrane protein